MGFSSTTRPAVAAVGETLKRAGGLCGFAECLDFGLPKPTLTLWSQSVRKESIFDRSAKAIDKRQLHLLINENSRPIAAFGGIMRRKTGNKIKPSLEQFDPDDFLRLVVASCDR